MRTTTILLAGAILSLAAFGGSNDRFAEQRYQMKNGTKGEAPAYCRRMDTRLRMRYERSTPAVEACEKAAAVETATPIQKCVELAKCTRMQAEESATVPFRPSLIRKPGDQAQDRQGARYATQVVCEHACCTGVSEVASSHAQPHASTE